MSQHFPPEAIVASRLSDAEAARHLARLGGLFSEGDLNIHADEPRAGTFAAKIRTPEFWHRQPGDEDQLVYTPAVAAYLQTCLGPTNHFTFEEYLIVWLRSFFMSRNDKESARDILVLFLIHNAEFLKHIYCLDSPHAGSAGLAPEAAPIDSATNECQALLASTRFAQWVLGDWLPRHLRYYHEQVRQAETVNLHWEPILTLDAVRAHFVPDGRGLLH